MKPILKSFDKEFPLHATEVYDRLEYKFTSKNEAEYMKLIAQEMIEELDLELEAYVEEWSRKGVPFEIKLVVAELENEVEEDKYETLKSQISW